MKHLPPILIVASLLFFSCHKALETPAVTATRTMLGSQDMVRDLDSAKLTITLVPVVTCYSFANGQRQKPCDIFVEIHCVLSRPLQATLGVELEGLDRIDKSDSLKPASIGWQMAPNTREFIFETNIPAKNNQNVPPLFRINRVSVVRWIN